jgi:hypothetical protein
MSNENAWNTFLAMYPMSAADEDDFFDFLISEGFDPGDHERWDDIPVSQLEVAWKAFQRRRDA